MHDLKNGSSEPTIPPPDDWVPPRIDPAEPAAVAVQMTLAWSVRRFVAFEPAARTGEIEGVHRLRTTTRQRLRTLCKRSNLCSIPAGHARLRTSCAGSAGRSAGP